LKVPKCSKGQPQPVLAHICPQQLRDSSSWKPSLRNADAYDENAKAPADAALVAMAYQSGFVPNGSRASTSCFSWKSKRATANSPSKCRTKSRPWPWTWQKIAVYG
jgi:protein involved in temperature-dependent protein secretion